MASGESKMSWYAEVILSYIIIEKQSDMERRHGSPHIVTSHSFLSHNFSVVFITESHEELWGKSDGYGWKKKKKRRIRLLGYLSRKNACGWFVASKSPSVTPFKWILSCWGGGHTPGINESLLGYEDDLKRGCFLFSPTQLLQRVKTVN